MKNVMKKTNILYLFIGICCAMASCVSEDELTPSSETIPISAVSATFAEGNYTYNLDPGAIFRDTVPTGGEKVDFVIPIPWFYPESSDNETSITKMQLRASIGNGCRLEPDLTIYDLTQKHLFTLTDYNGNKKQISITGNRFKLPYCNIISFKVTDNVTGEKYDGVIDEKTKEISIISADDLSDVKIETGLSPHATASISSGSFENADLSIQPTITVTAHNGTDTQAYLVKINVPKKVERGIRKGSAKILFVKQLEADLGIVTKDMTTGLAVTDEHVVINTRNSNSIYLDVRTGEKIGEINLGSLKGDKINSYNTADNDGNILISNRAPDAGTFKIWKLSSITAIPEVFIDWSGSSSTPIGSRFSINGSINSNAIITAPINDASSFRFARWTVVNGVLTSQTPNIVTITGLTFTSADNSDVMYTSDTDINADYFAVGYSGNRLSRISAISNTPVAQLDQISTNDITNSIDYAIFNNNAYVTFNAVAAFSWSRSDQAWLIDAEAGFTGNPGASGTSGTCPGVFWGAEKNIYGSYAINNQANSTYGSDAVIKVSKNGYYLYFYFMFCNGYVVGVQFDCIADDE